MGQWLRYHLERWLLRGASYRLAVLALAIVLVSTCGGLAVLPLASPDLPSSGDAVWWAFLRLTDPGYLGDDEGAWKRVVSTALTVSGYVLFMGALIAVMTQALDATLSRLERGETPIVARNHLLVIGWTDRSAAIVREFLLSQNRVSRFLSRRGATRRLHVVLMVEELSPAIQAEIAQRFGPLWDDRVVTLRSGSRLRIQHLERVAFSTAAAIVLPGTDQSADFAGSDIAAIKTLLSIANHPLTAESPTPPRVVAEIFDRRKVPLAAVAYAGELDVVPSDLHISRLIVQNLRSPGLSHVYGELLTHHHGATVFVRQEHGLHGLTVADAAGRFEQAVMLGLVRRNGSHNEAELNPPGDRVIQPGDRVVLIADEFAHTEAGTTGAPRPTAPAQVLEEPQVSRKVLVLGWSEKLAAMIEEMGTHGQEQWEVVVISVVPQAERTAFLDSFGPLPPTVNVQQVDADMTLPSTLQAAEPASYDSVVLLGSDWLRSDEEADARTLVGYLTLRQALADAENEPHVLIEITDPGNAELFDARRGEIVVSPLVISNLLAHVTLRSEILAVFDTLFAAGGPSLLFRKPADYELEGTPRFEEIARAVRRHGHVAVGMRRRKKRAVDGLDLAPNRSKTFDLEVWELVVMAPTSGNGVG